MNLVMRTMRGNGVTKWGVVWIGCLALIGTLAFLSSLSTQVPGPVRHGNCVTTTKNYGFSGNLSTTKCR